jgi:hypothetical protein
VGRAAGGDDGDWNWKREIEISGAYMKAFLVAYDHFKKHPGIPERKKLSENYALSFGQDSQHCHVLFE